jgi:NADPH:quinone reductase-like Zn-dependent oxidoreductase
MMKAVQVKQWGGPDVAVIEDVARPQPGPGEVLIRIKATSINPVDWKIREGYLHEYVPLPTILGSDFAGDIEALGEGISGLEVGAPVYGFKAIRGGSYAEFTTATLNDFAPKPTTLSYAEAAAVTHSGLSSWQALFDAAQLQAGQRVLIHAAAGGTGHLAVQFAKWKGAYVIGTASDANEAFLRELGVDEFINYKTTPFENVVKDVDVVFDAVGFDTTTRSLEVLKPGGTLVAIVTPPDFEEAAKRQINAKYVGGQANSEQLKQITQLIDSGKIKPHIGKQFSFAQIHDALELSQTGHGRGKIVVTMD